MRKLSLATFTIFLATWAIFHFLKMDIESKKDERELSRVDQIDEEDSKSILSNSRKNELDQIAAVINSKNVAIDSKTKSVIQKERVKYDNKKDLQNLVALLEQSYIDINGSVKDIKKIQDKIIKLKKEMGLDVVNSEKWDPRLVYYLMIQENYTYHEINLIHSLADNGISKDELEYIKELTRDEAFTKRINNFKNSEDAQRAIASYKVPQYREKDEYIEGMQDEVALEDKLIEMNYSDDEIMEMKHGYNQ